MYTTLNIIMMIIWLLSLPVMITGLVLVCIKKHRKNGLKTLGLGIFLFLSSLIAGVALVDKIKSDQITHNNEITASSLTALIDINNQDENAIHTPTEDTNDQVTKPQIEESKNNDGIGFLGWFLLVILTLFTLSTLYHYRQYKRKKHFEEQVSMLLSNVSPSNFSEASEMFPELDAYEYDYRLMRNEKLLGIQEYVTFISSKKTKPFGRLLVTNQAIVFESPEKNERITWTQIASASITYQGCQINRRSGIAWNYEFNAIPRFAAVVRILERYH
ncbi:hypothetical protein [Bartonella bovis]|uniref:Putative membrane protein n=1 Tax=Bartonella bovis 91-4 TaxID=1094491 RepID=N6VBE7_9HYPH|nr:hypothetical protein [Bartonella bovis]ENN91120.1 putative membrane protein [Bartonella bovis 91-4]